ncbi:MAG: SDR family NAD(P)-dependent oxidoreductase [Christensenellales bacterium]|jgi:NAD(P)-dependent dehydrogenase (short-subunit alcohol dehydrogenase family)
MLKELSLKGKSALVTGGGTGLGYGIARELIDLGAEVIIAGRRKDVLMQSAKELGSSWLQMDISDFAALDGFVDEAESLSGGIDILINNAGVQNNKPALDYDYCDFISMYDANLFGPYLLTCKLAKHMEKRGKGAVVFITSAAAHMGLTNNAAYSGSKGAVSAIVRALSSELSPKGIRVNAVAPGWIETELVKESLKRVPERRAMVERRALLGRLGTPKDIGMAVAFLASDAAAYITAVEIKVDGGIAVSL